MTNKLNQTITIFGENTFQFCNVSENYKCFSLMVNKY